MPLTREQILSKRKLRIEEVSVPEWGDTVFVKELNAAERDQFETSMMKVDRKGRFAGTNMVNLRARLAALAICDKDGNRLFSDEDAAALGLESAAVLDRVFSVAQRLAGITEADMADLEKNSVSGPAAASSSS